MTYQQRSLADTQKIIKNKFIKAYSSRIDHENDVNETIKPMSHNNRTSTKRVEQFIVGNKLCNRLQKLLDSQTKRNDHEIEMIIVKLRELDIIA